MLAYIIKLLLGSGIMYLYYLLFLRDKKFHRYNRFYLLAIVVLSFLIPLISFDFFVQSDNARINKLLEILYARQSADTVMIISGTSAREIPWVTIGYIAAAAVSITMLVLVCLRIIKVISLKRKFPIEQIQDIAFINTPLQEAPFSFFKNLFWRKDIQLNDETGQQIMRHEMAHIRQNHSWDRVFLQVVKAVCWFNPVFYLIEKEIILIHEYIADEEAIENKDGRAFAAMLLRSRIENFGYAPGQAIFYSSIKKRLHMLTNNQKTKFSYARRLLVLPLLGCVTFAFGFKAHQAEVKETVKQLEAEVKETAKQLKAEVATEIVSSKDTLPPLQGEVTGVTIFTSDSVQVFDNGKPFATVHGDGPLVISNNDGKAYNPLIVLDGKPLAKEENLESLVNSNDIKQIDVLKDEQATSKYGDKGKNGVILITTKGKKIENKESQKSLSQLGTGDIKDAQYLINGKAATKEEVDNIPQNMVEEIIVNKRVSPNTINFVLKKSDAPKEEYDKEFTTVENPATYLGNWQSFLRANLNSDIAVDNQAPPGTYIVNLSFRVDKEGKISQIKALNDPGYGTAKEAERVMEKSGKWNPATQNGQPVTSRHKLSITWQIQE